MTADIAKTRVDIERSNQRMKNFKTVSEVMPAAVLPLIDEIFTVICAVINMSSPIIGDDKFMKN